MYSKKGELCIYIYLDIIILNNFKKLSLLKYLKNKVL